ncbi:SusC/RagA family TonB-linked outer membrane protein [Dyadobacter bucti]|uniref:SusC/RagA family TonB-linked outer membrane protein n=1 Tax=Dyadobacter bucti TaxID=2572203 RepID=UPI001108E3BC|nr:SusC/RagA family TonB-linked outer membrane protein [Dyadobacter bucti]
MKKTRLPAGKGLFRPLIYNVSGFKKSPHRIMMTAFILAFSCLFQQVQASGPGNRQQQISISKSAIPIKDVLKEVEHQSPFRFLYNHTHVDVSEKVNVNVRSVSVPKALDEIFRNTDIGYKISGRQVILYKRANLRLDSVSLKTHDEMLRSGAPVFLVSGKVTTSSGEAIPGVNVLLKGRQSGTTTDLSGSYSIEVPGESAVLIFSYIGFVTQEVEIKKQTNISVTLIESVETLREAVVTALGVKREKRSLGYSVGNVEGTSINQTPQNNVLNSLSGKVAGVQISQMGGGVGSSVSMIIRGANSLNSDNQPLFVIDGVPVANKLSNSFAGADMGNPISDINPNDIANVSILKGPSAAALYGSRAGNGVVLITTKSGTGGKKGLGVSLNTSVVLDMPLKYVQVQNKFGSGKATHLLGEEENETWGAELDAGELWAQWNSNGVKVPLVSYPNRFKDFFQTGLTNTNNVSVNGNYEKGNFRLSVGNMKNRGIVPNTDLSRITLALNTTYNITDKLRASVNLNVTESGSDNRPMIDASRNDPVRSIYETGSQVNINDLREYWMPGLKGIEQRRYKSKQNNPFFLVYENPTSFRRDRTVSKIQLDYDITKTISITGRYARDSYEEILEAKKAYSNYEAVKGGYEVSNNYRKESNLDLIVAYKKNFNENWSLNAMAGASRLEQYTRSLYNSASALVIPGLYTISNGAPGTFDPRSSLIRKLLYGVYASASVGYKDMVYLDLTARNDWTSTLKKGNNSYFYPSASLSVIVSEMVKMPDWINMAKLRAGYAQVGNDVTPYSLVQTYSTALDWGEAKSMFMDGTLRNPELKPEISTSHEIGIDMKFLNNRLGLEATYYERGNKNQILSIGTPIESGASSKQINAGLVQSKGFELGIQATPVQNENFTWDMNFTLSRNRTYIKRLAEGIKYFAFTSYSGAEVRTYEGGQIGDIYMAPMLTVKDQSSQYFGYPIVTNGGFYQTDNDVNNLVKIGNFNHDFMIGFQPTIRYKNFTLFANVDWRQGGQFYSNTMMFLGNNGQLEETLSGVPYDPNRSIEEQIRENPEKYLGNWVGGRNAAYGGFPWPEGSSEAAIRKQDASLNPGVFVSKDAAGKDVYKENLGGPGSKWIDTFSAYRYANRPFPDRNLYSATYVKLREVSVTYHLPKTFVNRFKIQNASLAVVGNNLFMWTKAGIEGLDPERAFRPNGTSWSQGVEYYNVLPWTGSLGFKLNVDF